MTDIQERLFALEDESYAAFQRKLTPSATPETVIGVRVPQLRALAKELRGTKQTEDFIAALPHKYYDENMLHSCVLSEMKNYGDCVAAVNAFLPYVDNWAVCDILSPKCFKKHTSELLPEIRRWMASKETYTIRFGIEMLMSFYLDGEFSPEYLGWVAELRSGEYYVNMMIAWYFATALAKQYEATAPYIENRTLADWTHNKTIQKAVESYRISDEQKAYLKTLKVK